MRDPRHEHRTLHTILTSVVPWIAAVLTLAWVAAWVVSVGNGNPDGAALTVAILMAVLTAYALTVRSVLLRLLRDADTTGNQKP